MYEQVTKRGKMAHIMFLVLITSRTHKRLSWLLNIKVKGKGNERMKIKGRQHTQGKEASAANQLIVIIISRENR